MPHQARLARHKTVVEATDDTLAVKGIARLLGGRGLLAVFNASPRLRSATAVRACVNDIGFEICSEANGDHHLCFYICTHLVLGRVLRPVLVLPNVSSLRDARCHHAARRSGLSARKRRIPDEIVLISGYCIRIQYPDFGAKQICT